MRSPSRFRAGNSAKRFGLIAVVFDFLCLCLISDCVATERFLWMHQESLMGWGDKLHSYVSLLTHAAVMNRTAVLPPFQIATYNYSLISEIDIVDTDWDAFTRQYPSRSHEYVHESVAVEVSQWFDLSKLTVPAVSNSEWAESSGAVVDFAVLPTIWHGCVPMYDEKCAQAEEAGVWWLPEHSDSLPKTNVDGSSIRLHEVACSVGLTDLSSDICWESPRCTIALLNVLCDGCVEESSVVDKDIWTARSGFDLRDLTTRAKDATTLGFEGWCLRNTLPPSMQAINTAAYNSFQFQPTVETAVDDWLRKKGIARFLAIHWRRSDVLLDFRDQFSKYTPEHMAEAVRGWLPRATVPISDVVLVTDNFVRPEIDRLRELLRSATGLSLHRFSPDDVDSRRLPERMHLMTGQPPSEFSVAQVQALFMDLAIAGRSDAILTNYAVSNFVAFIQSRRKEMLGPEQAMATFMSTEQAIELSDTQEHDVYAL